MVVKTIDSINYVNLDFISLIFFYICLLRFQQKLILYEICAMSLSPIR
jgi:hypothetical protein